MWYFLLPTHFPSFYRKLHKQSCLHLLLHQQLPSTLSSTGDHWWMLFSMELPHLGLRLAWCITLSLQSSCQLTAAVVGKRTPVSRVLDLSLFSCTSCVLKHFLRENKTFKQKLWFHKTLSSALVNTVLIK